MESPPACRCRSARRRSERARDKELSPPPCATPGGRSARPRTCRCPPRPNRPSSIISAKMESPPACRCRSARRRSERARDKELSPPPCATPGGRSARPRTCRCPPRPNRPSSIISAKWNRRRRAGVVRRGAGRSEQGIKSYPRRRAQHPAVDRRGPVPAAALLAPTARAPSFPLKWNRRRRAGVVRRGAGRSEQGIKSYPRRRAQHPAVDRRGPVPAAALLAPTARAPSFPLKWNRRRRAGVVRRGAGRSEQGIKSIPAAVRNTRRSIGEAPYLPLPSSPQPPELHHFRKKESPPACRCRSARRRSERARDKELSPPPCATPGGRSARPRTCRCPPRPNRPSSIISAK